jgi:phosphatidyl-myo-inositol alpha-mannosyltransferase
MKVGIVVPYSWSFWGGVVEHAEYQARALHALGVETRTLIGYDPPGAFSRVLHPRSGRHECPPPDVIPLGRSVIVAANGSLANIVIGPSAVLRIRRVFRRERFDLVHVHEPLTPALGLAALAFFDGPWWRRSTPPATRPGAGPRGRCGARCSTGSTTGSRSPSRRGGRRRRTCPASTS